MRTYIALFRGINIGGHHPLAMPELAAILEGLGCKQVRTYIRSGNVVFQSAGQRNRLSAEISRSIQASHGFAPKALLLDHAELQAAMTNNPFDTSEGKALHLFFLESQPDHADLAKLDALKRKSEAFRLSGKVFYLFTPEGVGRSKLAASVEKCLGVPATARNWNTLRKLLMMAAE